MYIVFRMPFRSAPSSVIGLQIYLPGLMSDREKYVHDQAYSHDAHAVYSQQER